MRATLVLVAALQVATDALAAEPDWGLKLTASSGAPVAEAQGRSVRLTLEPSLKFTAPGLDLRARARLRGLERDGDERLDADVRELTMAWRGQQTTVTLGAQQLNWGRMDVIRLTDVLNPVDQHDLFYEELPEAKLALWMVNAEWQSGAHTVQVIATPQVSVDRLPVRVAGMPVQLSQPRDSVRNGSVAVRYGVQALGWTADFVAVHGWQPRPSLRPFADAAGVRLLGTVSRQDSIGFSADKPLGNTVLRLEGLLARVSPGAADAELTWPRRQQAALGVGVDVQAGRWFFAGQIIKQNDRGQTEEPSRSTFASAIVQRKWMQDRLSGRALYIRETLGGSSWSSLQVSFELTSNQLLMVQGDRFRGAAQESFGGLRDRSRIAATLRVAL